MSDKNEITSGGIGIGGLLGVAFIILKLCHVIEWKWIWVLAPFWIGFAVVMTFLLVYLVYLLITAIFNKKKVTIVEHEVVDKE